MLLSNLDLLATAPGGVARLRELILTLAVQGKLVPQDAGDEPASVLLEKIGVEKERLIAEGKIKRDKPLAEIAPEEKEFQLPIGWEWVRLGDIGYTNIGLTYSPNNVSDTGTPVLRSNNVQLGKLDLSDLKRVNMKIKDSVLVAEGDLLICARNGSKALVGKTAMISGLSEPMAFGAFMAIFRSGVNAYVLHFINAPLFRRMISDVNTTTINQITQENLRSTIFPLPPLAEQSRIVTRVEELMQLCDALEAKGRLEAAQHARLVSTLLATLTDSPDPEALAENWQRVSTHFDLLLDRPEAVDALEQTLLQLAVRGLLVPQDPQDEPASALLKRIRAEKDRLIAEGKIKRDGPLVAIAEEEKPFGVPVGWEWVRFGQVANIASNLVSPALHADKWQVAPDCISKGTGQLLKKRTVTQAEIISPNHLFKPGQILYSKIRPSLSKAVLVDFEGLCSADMYPIESSLNSNYMLMYILSEPFLEQVSIAENRVKMPKLNKEALVAFMVTLPPLPEQARIVARVASLRRLCADLRQRLAARQATQAQLAHALIEEAA